jgi:hypothetical protein
VVVKKTMAESCMMSSVRYGGGRIRRMMWTGRVTRMGDNLKIYRNKT